MCRCKMNVITQMKGGMREEANGPTGCPGSPDLSSLLPAGRAPRLQTAKRQQSEREKQKQTPLPLPESSKTTRAMQTIQTERGGEEIDVRKQTDRHTQKEKHFSPETKAAAAAAATCVSLFRGSKHSRRSPARLSLRGGWL